MKKILLILLSFTSLAFAQNIMSINGGTGSSGDTLDISIDIDNADAFTGFQCDIVLPEQATYVDGSASLSSRISDHQMVATNKENGTLTIFAYSMSLSEFSGSSGTVMTFKIVLGKVPGTYSLPLTNATIANSASQNILSSTVNGTFTIQAPDINVSPTSIDYGRVPLLQTSDRSFTIQNNGNSDLTVNSITSDFADFEVLGSTSFILSPGNSRSVTVRFHSNAKGTYNKQVTIQSDDPDESVQTVDLSVIAYAVNELDINNMFGRSGHEAELSIDISNMEDFVGFSFDLDIPDVLTLVPGSAELTDRKANHVVTATTLSNGNVRIVAYSSDNTPFTGNSGDVLTVDFLVDGQGGYYTLNFVNPVIGDENGDNIISDDYNGTLEIAAPDIYVNPGSLSYGNVSVFDTLIKNTTVYNYGSDTLNISNIVFYDPEYFADQSLPIILAPGQNTQIPVSYHNANEGSINSTMRIRSNDPDEDPTDLSLSATSYIPNIMRIDTSYMVRNDEGWLDISIENYEEFVAFQCDVQFPPEFTFLGEAVLSDRKTSHSITAREKTGNIVNIFAYSLSQEAFSGQEGVVFSLKFSAPSTMTNYNFSLSDVIIGNAASENIMSSYENGIAQVITSGPTLSDFPIISFKEDEDTVFNISSLVTDPNTDYADLTWTFDDHDSLSLNVSGENLQISANQDWNGSRTVEVKVSDGELEDITTFSITVTAVNDAPIALDDSVSTNEDIAVSTVLKANDIDSETLVFSIIDSTLHGDLEGDIPNLTFKPERDYSGIDSLRFTVSDGEFIDTGFCVITISPVNDAPEAVYQLVQVVEDSSCQINLSATDVEENPLEFTLLDSTRKGLLSGDLPDLTYKPGLNYFGMDSLHFIVSDGQLSDTGLCMIEVLPVNDAPVAMHSVYDAKEDTELAFTLLAHDVDLDTLVYTILDSTINGELTGTGPNLIYMPDQDYFGPDSLIFIVSDKTEKDTAKCHINVLPVNDAPVWASIPDTSFNEDDSLKVPLASILFYLSDQDNEVNELLLDYNVPDVFRYGMIDSLLYLTAEENWFGFDSIQLLASDGIDTSFISWKVHVLPVNDPPIFTSFMDSTLYFDADKRDTIPYAKLFNDIDTPDSNMVIDIQSNEVMADILTDRAMIVLYTEENKSINEKIRISLNDGDNEVFDSLNVEITEVAIEIIPDDFALYPAYPNPFNPMTTICYDIPERSDVRMVIYDITGRKVRTLINTSQDAKSYKVIWNGLDNYGNQIASGMYICRIMVKGSKNTFVSHQKLLFIK